MCYSQQCQAPSPPHIPGLDSGGKYQRRPQRKPRTPFGLCNDFSSRSPKIGGKQGVVGPNGVLAEVRRKGNHQNPRKKVEISRGSKNHAYGHCRPCRLCFTPAGCPDGALCNFCHHYHDEHKILEMEMFSLTAKLRRIMAQQEQLQAALMEKKAMEYEHLNGMRAKEMMYAPDFDSANIGSPWADYQNNHCLTSHFQEPVEQEFDNQSYAPNPAMLPWPAKMADGTPTKEQLLHKVLQQQQQHEFMQQLLVQQEQRQQEQQQRHLHQQRQHQQQLQQLQQLQHLQQLQSQQPAWENFNVSKELEEDGSSLVFAMHNTGLHLSV